jgi:ABC-type polar amino acid transport system ATPase subunit
MLHRLRRSVGLVFQFHCLFEHMSALQNVCLAPVHVHATPHQAAEQAGRDLLRQLGVESRADAWPRELSGGEAQRVAIARALAVNPPVLLMDEPMASLDPSRRAELGALLQRLTASGRTLLVTTHDERFAEDFATRILTIEGGSVKETVGG